MQVGRRAGDCGECLVKQLGNVMLSWGTQAGNKALQQRSSAPAVNAVLRLLMNTFTILTASISMRSRALNAGASLVKLIAGV